MMFIHRHSIHVTASLGSYDIFSLQGNSDMQGNYLVDWCDSIKIDVDPCVSCQCEYSVIEANT